MATEQERLAAEFVEWMNANTDEERERIRSGWSGEKPKTTGLVIEARTEPRREQASDALRAIVAASGTGGIAPLDALAELREQGFGYRLTDSELGHVKTAAGIGCTRVGQRAYRWTTE